MTAPATLDAFLTLLVAQAEAIGLLPIAFAVAAIAGGMYMVRRGVAAGKAAG